MQRQESQVYNTSMLYREPSSAGDNTFHGHSIKIVLPPKPGQCDEYRVNGNDVRESRMDVCALTLSCLAQDPNLPSSKLPFAWKLYEMLETVHKNKVDTDIVSWVDNGEGFKVHDLNRFVDEIVPTYFKQSKYKSFQRQLYFYGFTRETSSKGKTGRTPGSYRHPKFIRGKKTLCLSMAPKKTRKKRSKSPVLVSIDDTSTNRNKNVSHQQFQNDLTADKLNVARTISVELPNENEDGIAPITLYPPPGMDATLQASHRSINDESNDHMMPIPLRRESSSANTIEIKNGMDYDGHNAVETIPQLRFQQQQNQLQRLQMEGFLRSLHQNDRINLSVQSVEQVPQAPTLRASVSDGRECKIFGGTFHVVGSNRRH